MAEPVPSTCPRCQALLDHSRQSPGGMDAPLLATCPDCEYEESFLSSSSGE